MTWSGARRARLPADWQRRRRLVLRRDPMCVSCGQAPSTDVDHIVAGDDHRLANLQGLCRWCHAAKTQAESRAATQARAAKRWHPAEKHPGLR